MNSNKCEGNNILDAQTGVAGEWRMENKRAQGGFIGTAIGAAMTAIQGTKPDWFGSHPWILPVSLLVLLGSLLFWLTQYHWLQKLLGFHQSSAIPPSSPLVAPQRAIMERQDLEQTYTDKIRKLELHHKEELERARKLWEEEKRDYANQCLDYRAELARYTELFSPLQIEAFQLAGDLRAFLKELGPRPDADWNATDESDPDWAAKKLTERSRLQGPWVMRLMHAYAGNYAPSVKSITHKLGQMNLPVGPLYPYTDSAGSEVDILHVARTLDTLALEIGYQSLAARDDDRDTVRKYEDLTASQMEQIIRSYPEARKLIDAAYKRVEPTKRPF